MSESQSTLLTLFLSQNFQGWRTVFSEGVIRAFEISVVQELRPGKLGEKEEI